jgi:hypothetical protein
MGAKWNKALRTPRVAIEWIIVLALEIEEGAVGFL